MRGVVADDVVRFRGVTSVIKHDVKRNGVCFGFLRTTGKSAPCTICIRHRSEIGIAEPIDGNPKSGSDPAGVR